MPESNLKDEMQRMESEYEPLLPVENKLIWYTLACGIVLLVGLVFLSRLFA